MTWWHMTLPDPRKPLETPSKATAVCPPRYPRCLALMASHQYIPLVDYHLSMASLPINGHINIILKQLNS